jgi:hypothetical protein
MMACLAVMRTLMRRMPNDYRAMLTDVVYAATQQRMRAKYQARQQMVKSLHWAPE